jgi:chromosome segregation protein
MTDVIFNGSSERKPVGQASVELIFDNSDQSIVGEYAAYNEISVRRLVTRESQSTYFLNGQRCRRRDITDLFLGTGLGARSYSIIEQGMISQSVESAPEDLRVHLEEAAGISKYKDRRKETESRMKATRENLDRLNDVREEVDKQLDHLERQAKQAERYTELKAEQRHKDAQYKGLVWRELNKTRQGHDDKLSASEHQLLELATAATTVLQRTETLRETHHDLGEAFNQVQSATFSVGAEISRLEQELRFRNETAARLAEERARNTAQGENLERQFDFDQQQLEQLDEQLLLGEPQLDALREANESAGEALSAAESALAILLTQTQAQARDSAEATKAAEVARTRIELLERALSDGLRRRDGLLVEAAQIDLAQLQSSVEAWELKLEQGQLELTAANEQLQARQAEQQLAVQQLEAGQQRLRQLEAEGNRKRARLASLEALQHAALGQERKSLNEWLRQRGLAQARRLGEVLSVDEGYECAVEVVLDDLLEALVIDAPDTVLNSEAPPMALTALRMDMPQRGAPGTLAGKVLGPPAVQEWLAHVRLAETLDQALNVREELARGWSVITPQGSWLGRDWSRAVGQGMSHDGVLLRAREIESLQLELDALEQSVEQERNRLSTLDAQRSALGKAREEAQQQAYTLNRRLAELSGQLQAQRGRLETVSGRSAKIAEELAQIDAQLEVQHAQVRETRGAQSSAVGQMDELEQQRLALDEQRRAAQAQLEQMRLRAREAQSQSHQLEVRIEQQRTARKSLQSAMQRIDEQRRATLQRREELQRNQDENAAPIPQLKQSLSLALEQKSLRERELTDARRALENCTQELQRMEAERVRIEQAEMRLREGRNAEQLALAGLAVRIEQLEQQIAALEFDRELLLSELPDSADMEARSRELSDLEHKIRRLEPVNLAAIKELEESRTRKSYLDTQLADLNDALATLDEAIRKIDRETRSRFKETFDQVSEGMKELFPKLFGGGHAYLELTSEDLLTTGVNIIARPPGKRPASIGLLSGGEKALTAVALVFAIFRLNPAPFCLLDEVDAPLDEANVGRFCNMVREMSQTVQFMFVTHNKVTMEMSTQLAGVTMREAGVSRLVTVDLAEATRLVG